MNEVIVLITIVAYVFNLMFMVGMSYDLRMARARLEHRNSVIVTLARSTIILAERLGDDVAAQKAREIVEELE